jgi:GTP-binding protein HflX
VDTTHPNALHQAQAVHETLREIKADHIPSITLLNKIDRLPEPQSASALAATIPGSVAAISAVSGEGISNMLSLISRELFDTYVPLVLRLPYQAGDLISLFHDQGRVEKVEHTRGGVILSGSLPVRLLARYQTYHYDPAASPHITEEEI